MLVEEAVDAGGGLSGGVWFEYVCVVMSLLVWDSRVRT